MFNVSQGGYLQPAYQTLVRKEKGDVSFLIDVESCPDRFCKNLIDNYVRK